MVYKKTAIKIGVTIDMKYCNLHLINLANKFKIKSQTFPLFFQTLATLFSIDPAETRDTSIVLRLSSFSSRIKCDLLKLFNMYGQQPILVLSNLPTYFRQK